MTITMSSAYSPTFSSLLLRHSSFSNPSAGLPTSQLILQPFHCSTYVTAHSPTFFRFSLVTGSSLTSPGGPPMLFPGLPVSDQEIAGLQGWTSSDVISFPIRGCTVVQVEYLGCEGAYLGSRACCSTECSDGYSSRPIWEWGLDGYFPRFVFYLELLVRMSSLILKPTFIAALSRE